MSRPSSRNNHSSQSHSRSNSRRSSVANGLPSHSPNQPPDPFSFCNAFWGELGYDTLQSKTRNSTRMLEDLRAWYKERAAIEEDYAKKLTKLTKSPLFETHQINHSIELEVGGIRKALETVKDTTRQSAHSHLELAGTIRTALEKKVAEFVSRRDGLKKNPQVAIEKLYKRKTELLELTEKARKKYEADAIAVNGLSAQTHLVQGRDFDKVSAKLDKAQQNVQMDEREYRSHVKNLKDTTAEWNMQWKGYCDLMQDLEEERIDFIRTSFWDYANGVSTICVVDDEQCEIIRKALERCDTGRDVSEFVRHARTGSDIFMAHEYVNYARGEQTPYTRPPAVQANFVRSSIRNPRAVHPTTSIQDLVQAIRSGPSSPTDSIHPPVALRSSSKAAVKRGGAIADAVAVNSFTNAEPNAGLNPRSSLSRSSMGASISRAASPAEAMAQVVGGTTNSLSSRSTVQNHVQAHNNDHQGANASHAPSLQHFSSNHSAPHPVSQKQHESNITKQEPSIPPPTPASAKPANRYAPNFGSKEHSQTSNALPAPFNRPASRASTNGGIQPPSVPLENGQVDPLVAALEKLRSTPSISSFHRSPAPSVTPGRARPTDGNDGRRSALERPTLNGEHNRASSPAPNVRRSTLEQPSLHDPYKRSSSPAVSARRSTLNEPPSIPYQRASSPSAQRSTLDHRTSHDPYQRSSSPAVTNTMRPPNDMRSNGGRSPSPQPYGGYNRGATPSPVPSSSNHIPMTGYQPPRTHELPAHARPQSYTSMSSRVGGVDSSLNNNQQHPKTSSHQPTHQHSHSQPAMAMISSPSSYNTGVNSQLPFRQQQVPQTHGAHQTPIHHSQPSSYGAPRPPQHYGYPPSQNEPPPASTTPGPGQAYRAQSVGGSTQTQYQMGSSQSQSFGVPQQHQYYGSNQGPPPSSDPNQVVQRADSIYRNPPQAHPPQQQQQLQQQQQQQLQQQQQPSYYQGSQSLVHHPPPSPQPIPQSQSHPISNNQVPSPTGNYTQSGQPILFYVRALYDYNATMSEEFSFKANDIIGITQTDPDGWWQGELIDEIRRNQSQKNGTIGGNVLPSNFVETLN